LRADLWQQRTVTCLDSLSSRCGLNYQNVKHAAKHFVSADQFKNVVDIADNWLIFLQLEICDWQGTIHSIKAPTFTCL
jgi:hypothetical protein